MKLEKEPAIKTGNFTRYNKPPKLLETALRVNGSEVTLKVGQYTPWVPVEFPAAAGISVKGICEFLLLSTEPEFELYASPVNIDPLRPVTPITAPEDLSAELADRSAGGIGLYYTQGMPENTKALTADVLTRDAFLAPSDIVMDETERMLDRELARFREGLLFFYVSSSDQVAHMFWRAMSPDASPEERPYAEVMPRLYERLDRMLGGLVALGACGNDEAKRIDQLRKDLVLAGAYPQPYVSPLEQGYGNAPGYQPQPYRNAAYTPASARSTPVVRRAPVYASTMRWLSTAYRRSKRFTRARARRASRAMTRIVSSPARVPTTSGSWAASMATPSSCACPGPVRSTTSCSTRSTRARYSAAARCSSD